jgi:predicted glycosyltransferase
MRWVFDIDSVITANPDFFKWWIYHLRKNGHEVLIVTGRNPARKSETKEELKMWGISYDSISFMPKSLPRDFRTQAEWKLRQIEEIKPDVWVDDNFKIYEQGLGISMTVEGVVRIEI